MVTDGRQLKAGRIILGLTVKEMARLAGIHRNSVLRVESFGTLPFAAYAADRIMGALKRRGIIFTVKDGLAGVQFKAANRRTKKPYRKKANSCLFIQEKKQALR